MAAGGRAQRRAQMLRMAYLAAGVLIVLTLILALAGAWIPAIVTAVLAAAAVWYVRQVRAVR
jgi:CHASE2 domain-containing sensor protein